MNVRRNFSTKESLFKAVTFRNPNVTETYENDDEAGSYCALDLVTIQVSTIQSPESSQIPSSTSDSNIETPTFSTPLNESNNNKNPTSFQTLSHNTRNTNQLESPSKIKKK